MVLNKSMSDNLMMARIREELDMMINIKKEDRVIMTGLTNPTPMPFEADAKKKWLHDMVSHILNDIDEMITGKIIFVNHVRKWSSNHKFVNGDEIPAAEVKFQSKEIADKIRKSFVEGKKADKVTG